MCVAQAVFIWASPCVAEECSEENPEVFESFLSRFAIEKPFAIERTQLPLRITRWDDAIDIEGRKITDPQKFDLSLAEYWRWPTLSEYILEHHLESNVTPHSSAKVRLDLSKAAYPLKVSYVFGSHKGCWVLEQYEARPI